MTEIAVIDYDLGNLHSVCKGLEKVGATPNITYQPEDIQKADGIVLPGVGAFDPTVKRLRSRKPRRNNKRGDRLWQTFPGYLYGTANSL